MHKIHNSGINVFGVIPLCHFFGQEDNSCFTDTIEMKLYMASVMRKGTFGHMQKMQTQTSRSVSDAASGQGLHFLTLDTSMAHILLAV